MLLQLYGRLRHGGKGVGWSCKEKREDMIAGKEHLKFLCGCVMRPGTSFQFHYLYESQINTQVIWAPGVFDHFQIHHRHQLHLSTK